MTQAGLPASAVLVIHAEGDGGGLHGGGGCGWVKVCADGCGVWVGLSFFHYDEEV